MKYMVKVISRIKVEGEYKPVVVEGILNLKLDGGAEVPDEVVGLVDLDIFAMEIAANTCNPETRYHISRIK